MCFLSVSVGEVESLLLSVGTCSLPSLRSQPPALRVFGTKQVKLCLSRGSALDAGVKERASLRAGGREATKIISEAELAWILGEPMEIPMLNVPTHSCKGQIEG